MKILMMLLQVKDNHSIGHEFPFPDTMLLQIGSEKITTDINSEQQKE